MCHNDSLKFYSLILQRAQNPNNSNSLHKHIKQIYWGALFSLENIYIHIQHVHTCV